MHIIFRPSKGKIYLYLSKREISEISSQASEHDTVFVSSSELGYQVYKQLDLIFHDRAEMERMIVVETDEFPG
jgi:hypothetical protein